LTEVGFRVPPALEPLRGKVIELVETLEVFQRNAAADLLNEEMPFSIKKEITSALRRLAPIGLSTSIVWTANIRTLRHVIAQRTEAGAEEEMRFVFDRVAKLVVDETPALFQDFIRLPDGCWVPKHHKV